MLFGLIWNTSRSDSPSSPRRFSFPLIILASDQGIQPPLKRFAVPETAV
jgi:hypothetical protein